MLRDDVSIAKLIEDYARAIVEVQAPGAETFIEEDDLAEERCGP
jgi:hypothetical protein